MRSHHTHHRSESSWLPSGGFSQSPSSPRHSRSITPPRIPQVVTQPLPLLESAIHAREAGTECPSQAINDPAVTPGRRRPSSTRSPLHTTGQRHQRAERRMRRARRRHPGQRQIHSSACQVRYAPASREARSCSGVTNRSMPSRVCSRSRYRSCAAMPAASCVISRVPGAYGAVDAGREPSNPTSRSMTRSGWDRKGEWPVGHSTLAVHRDANDRCRSGWTVRSFEHTT